MVKGVSQIPYVSVRSFPADSLADDCLALSFHYGMNEVLKSEVAWRNIDVINPEHQRQ